MRILQQDQVDIDENVLRRSSAKLVVTSARTLRVLASN